MDPPCTDPPYRDPDHTTSPFDMGPCPAGPLGRDSTCGTSADLLTCNPTHLGPTPAWDPPARIPPHNPHGTLCSDPTTMDLPPTRTPALHGPHPAQTHPTQGPILHGGQDLETCLETNHLKECWGSLYQRKKESPTSGESAEQSWSPLWGVGHQDSGEARLPETHGASPHSGATTHGAVLRHPRVTTVPPQAGEPGWWAGLLSASERAEHTPGWAQGQTPAEAAWHLGCLPSGPLRWPGARVTTGSTSPPTAYWGPHPSHKRRGHKGLGGPAHPVRGRRTHSGSPREALDPRGPQG